ncbi:MAG: isoaspartyl peptidase/L-asparaginase [Gemmatimonadales bacterium]|nr:MAG: isoaspartyl peptidase/L-asparaginase [Gemmatimonadales bacterium]
MIPDVKNSSLRWIPACLIALTVALATGCDPADDAEANASNEADLSGAEYGLVIHGGAGTIVRDNMTEEMEEAFHAALAASLEAGNAVLEEGGSALDAVIAAVEVMEDDSLFNAGRGAVFTAEGTNELDAGIMDGATLNAGAVTGVREIRNPIQLARLVMDESPHVFMAGEGAEVFAEQFDLERVDPEWFYTERRWEALERAREDESFDLSWWEQEGRMLGTVGAVARDRDGNLAAATSTGGMTNKRFGRVGDVPVIGAGTYASNESCAVSTTGHGEYFIRNVVARDVCARMEYLGESVQEAADALILERLADQGANGGLVAIDRNGHIAMPMNTPGMYRGHFLAGGEPFTAIYSDEGDGSR